MSVMLQSGVGQQLRLCCLAGRQQTLQRQHQTFWHQHSVPERQARRRCECWTSSASYWCLAGSPEQTFPDPGQRAAAHASSAFTPNNVFSLVTIAIMPLYTMMVGFPRCQLVSTSQIWQLSLVRWVSATHHLYHLLADAAASHVPSHLPGRRRPLPCPPGSLGPLRHLERHIFSIPEQLWLP